MATITTIMKQNPKMSETNFYTQKTCQTQTPGGDIGMASTGSYPGLILTEPKITTLAPQEANFYVIFLFNDGECHTKKTVNVLKYCPKILG